MGHHHYPRACSLTSHEQELRSANTDVVILRPHSYLTYELDKFSNLYEGGAEPSQTEMEEWFHTKFIKQKSR
jgi:hypothetical protein